ncbi:MAG: M12 family metallo-peptidase [Planctomycetota bacterium]|nr:M12 family metallo-peptidase [Planctomycetota bacterium]
MDYAIHSTRWLGLTFALVLLAPASGQTIEERFEVLAREKMNLVLFELQSLAVPANDRRAMQVSIVLDGKALTLELQPSSVRATNFRVVTVDRWGRRNIVSLPPETTYQGWVQGKPDSRIAASIIDGGLRAQIFIGDRQWGVQPASELDPEAGPAAHVVYRSADIIQGEWACAADVKNAGLNDAPLSQTDTSFGSACETIAEIAYDTDVEYYVLNGSSVPNTVADIESINNAMNVIYTRDVDLSHAITEIIVRTSEPDPYTSSDSITLLDEFYTHWSVNHSPSSADPVLRDVAHLMTGKIMNGGFVGRAYFNGICANLENGNGYGFSQSRYSTSFLLRTQLTAHELGHNWSASHCDGAPDCGVMCSSVTSCTTIHDQFGAWSVSSIIGFRNSLSCLTNPPPQESDCNNNCIADLDEIADGSVADCNSNGIPDPCDFFSFFAASSGQLSPIGLGSPVQYVIPAPPQALSDVTIDIDAIAQMATQTKYIDITVNGSYYGRLLNAKTTLDCPLSPESDFVIIPMAEYNALLGGGDLTIDLVADSSLPFDCNGSPPWVSIDVSYSAASGVEDINNNMIPDECDLARGDNNLDGVVNVDDLLNLLAKWGQCAVPCLEDTDLNGVVDVEDLLTLLANWG